MSFNPIVGFDPLPQHIIDLIYQHASFIITGKIDREVGCGKIDKYSKAVWTTDGKRITIYLKDAFMIYESKEVDPMYAARRKEIESLRVKLL